MKRIKIIIILILVFSPALNALQLKSGDITGNWKLLYRGNFGYEFRFYKNYRSLCILYLRSKAIIFKGVFTIEESDKIRINIYEMKNETNPSQINLRRNFNKASSSYFIFKGEIEKNKNKKSLILKPVNIIIDGRSSDGYFEPVIKLDRKG